MCSCATTTGIPVKRPRITAQTLEPKRCPWTTSIRSRLRVRSSGAQAQSAAREPRLSLITRTPASERRARWSRRLGVLEPILPAGYAQGPLESLRVEADRVLDRERLATARAGDRVDHHHHPDRRLAPAPRPLPAHPIVRRRLDTFRGRCEDSAGISSEPL